MRLSTMHALGLSFILIACSPGSEPGADMPDAQSAPWEISRNALLGPFHADLPLTVDALEAALPDFSARLEQRSVEGEAYDVVVLSHEVGGAPVFEVSASWQSQSLADVKIYEAGHIAGLRADIGDSFSASGFEPADCFSGMEEMSGRVSCMDERYPGLIYWFDPSPYDGPDGEIPPISVLNDANLFMMHWHADPR